MKKILFLFFLLIPSLLFANVRGLRPIDGEYSWRVTGNLNITSMNIREDLTVLGTIQQPNLVMVKSLDDLPAPSGNKIALVGGTSYIIATFLVLPNKLTIDGTGSVSIQPQKPGIDGIYFNGTGALFELEIPTGNIFGIVGTGFLAVSSGTNNLFDVTGGGFLFVDKFIAANFASGGTVACDQIALNISTSGFGQGILIDGASLAGIDGNLHTNFQNNPNTYAIATTGNINQLFIFDCQAFMTGSNEAFLNIDSITVQGSVQGNIVTGNFFTTDSDRQDNVNYTFTGNPGIADSTAIGQMFFKNNALDTIIDDVSIAKKVNAVWLDDLKERFSFSASGNFTYTGLEPAKVKLDGVLFLEPALGVTKLLASYFAKLSNGNFTVTFNNTTEKVQETGHSLINGDTIMFANSGGALPAEIKNDNFYYVINAGANDFEVSLTEGGATVAFGDDGTGTNTYRIGELFEYSEDPNSISNAAPKTVKSIYVVELVAGDTVFMMVENETDANEITVVNGIFIVTKT